MTVFYLLRHGYANYDFPEKNDLGILARQLAPLTYEGCRQIEEVAQKLRNFSAELILSSPITRALQSAAILSRRLDLPINVELDLHEWMPYLTCTTEQQNLIRNAYREIMGHNEDLPHPPIADWETLFSLRQRVQNVLRRYIDLSNVIVVTHGVIISGLTGEEVQPAGFQRYRYEHATNF